MSNKPIDWSLEFDDLDPSPYYIAMKGEIEMPKGSTRSGGRASQSKIATGRSRQDAQERKEIKSGQDSYSRAKERSGSSYILRSASDSVSSESANRARAVNSRAARKRSSK